MTLKALFGLASGFIVSAALLVAGCGGGGSSSPPGSITLAADKTAAATGTNITLTVNATDATGAKVVDGTAITFTTTAGTLSETAVTTVGGAASVTISSATAGSASVTATADEKTSSTVDLTFVTQPTTAVVKLATSGTLPVNTHIGAISATVTYPTTNGLSITAANAVLSGVGAGSFLQPNVNTAGQVLLGLINAPSGISTGEFATLTFTIAAGNFPVASDFAIAPGAAVGSAAAGGGALSGISVTIESVTIQ